MADYLELEDWGSGVQVSLDSPSDTTTQAEGAPAPGLVHISSWTNSVIIDDEVEKTHRKRGPKRGTGSNLPKRQRLATDAELEEHVAYCVGLDAYGMNEGESGLLADDTEEEAYYQVRNHILARWRADVTQYLSEQEAASKILAKHQHLVSTAWRYLDHHGHINWGVAPAVMGRPAAEHQETVVVIGAGLAGLSAARQLTNHGYKVIVVEGCDRPGGRVFTQRMESGDAAAVADLGGSIITGIDGNPLAVLAKQLDIPMHDINSDDVPLYMRDGSQLDQAVDMQVMQVFNKLLDRSSELREQLGPGADALSLQASLNGLWQRIQKRLDAQQQQQQQQGLEGYQATMANGATQSCALLPVEHRQHQASRRLSSIYNTSAARDLLMQWHMANIEFANAAQLRSLSMLHWDLDDVHEHQGAHVFLPGGNLRLLEGLAQGIPIFYKSPAQLLQYSSSGVQVHTEAGVFAADAAIVTVPLGVLKREDELVFQPPLPAKKRAAIKRLGFGCLNKVMMLFPHCFWGSKDMFGHVHTDTQQRGMYYLFYTYNHTSGGAVLAALVAGDAAVAFEQKSQQECVAEVMQLLRGIFAPQGVEVPDPLQAVCTRWGSEPLFYGSYSSVSVGSAGAADYDIMARPLGDRVFFAGEATTARYPATMHGAFATGLREAARAMTAFAHMRGEDIHPKQQRGVPEVDDLTASEGLEIIQRSQLLHKLFDFPGGAPAPDMQFGNFNAIFGHRGSGLEDQALVAINMAALGPKAKQVATCVYITLSREQLELLREIPGDERRLAMLTTEFGVRPLTRRFEVHEQHLLEAILGHRQVLRTSREHAGGSQ